MLESHNAKALGTDLRASARVLVFTATYNERDNIGLLIDAIAGVAPHADILVVDDNSPDGTWEVIQERRIKYKQLKGVKRPRKLGIGTAHKYAVLYAIRESYDFLLTMDADFSHHPLYIPLLLNEAGSNVFVTGSRYCKGGSCGYTGYRAIVSRLGNLVARHLLSLPLFELTTYFRVFDVSTLRILPLSRINASGYTYGVQLIYYLKISGVKLKEVPIHFLDRVYGESKIPKLQILLSALDVMRLSFRRPTRLDYSTSGEFIGSSCIHCGDSVLALEIRRTNARFKNALEQRAGAVPIYRCLNCDQLQTVISSSEPFISTEKQLV